MESAEKIDSAQMGRLFLAFTIGSSIVFIPGPTIESAGNGAWLSILISGAGGFVLLVCVLALHRRFPDLSIVQYSSILFGRGIGAGLSMLLILVLILMIANITLGLGSFFTTTMMVETPLYVFHFFILLAAACTVQAGIEVMARLFGIFLPTIMATIYIILSADLPLYDPGMLLPQFADGFRPILRGAFISYGFPYAEVFLFAALLHMVRQNRDDPVGKRVMGMMGYNILTFLVTVLGAVMVYGPAAGERKYALYEMAKVIEIGGVFERVEAIAGIALTAGSYMKATIALQALVTCFTHLFKLDDNRIAVFPLTLIIFFVSLTMFPNSGEAERYWTMVWPMVTVYSSVVLVVSTVTALLRFRKGN